MTAVISSMLLGFKPTHTAVMPELSSWNTPLVLPAESISNTAGSFSGILSTSKSGSCSRTIFAASSRTVRFLRPKKSILRSPSSSSVVIWYWHTTDSSFFDRGTYSYTGLSVMTTPAACILACRGIPSKASATSMSRCMVSSFSYISRSGFEILSASLMVMPSAMGTFFATLSVSA